MFPSVQIIYLVVFFILFNLIFCLNFTDDISGEVSRTSTTGSFMPRGLLSQGCINNYHRVFLTRHVPARTYNYFHEEPVANEVSIGFRIVGGNDIDIENAPYAVLYGPYCGGTLIAPEWVLTAAHCEDRYDYVLAGATRTTESYRFPICTHFFHPRWTAPHNTNFYDWDFQLLLLETSVPFTPRSMPIAIGRAEDIVPGTFVAVTGWGYIAPNTGEMQTLLRQVFVPVMAQEICLAIPNKYYQIVTPRMFCAGYNYGQKDACQGDSGGPAVFNNRLIGLVSYGIGCAEPGHPGVYTRVPLARPWIREITGLPL